MTFVKLLIWPNDNISILSTWLCIVMPFKFFSFTLFLHFQALISSRMESNYIPWSQLQ